MLRLSHLGFRLPAESAPRGSHHSGLRRVALTSGRNFTHRVRIHPACATGNYYEVLEVATDATIEDIRTAFRKKARVLHPDVNKEPGADRQFMQLKRAYDTLCEPMLRSEHDGQLGLESARARDPRFARFERWRREVVPDLRMNLDVWTREIEMLIDEVSQQCSRAMVDLEGRLQNAQQLVLSSDSGVEEALEDLTAAVNIVSRFPGDVRAQVQRLYEKRYDQVSMMYPAYPDIVWYDIWEEVSDEWVGKAEALAVQWSNASNDYRAKLNAIKAAASQLQATSSK